LVNYFWLFNYNFFVNDLFKYLNDWLLNILFFNSYDLLNYRNLDDFFDYVLNCSILDHWDLFYDLYLLNSVFVICLLSNDLNLNDLFHCVVDLYNFFNDLRNLDNSFLNLNY